VKGLTGTYLGQYHLKEIIGVGAMSTVYRAYQESLDRYVAVKVLLHHHDQQIATRFKQEARALAKLHHEYILPMYDFNDQEGLLYIVLQYVEGGRTLNDLLVPMEPLAALRLTGYLLEALDQAHQHGITHRDIKPSNVLLLPSNKPLLADFGIAKFRDTGLYLTSPGQIIGTPAFAAPEQVRGQAIDSRTDLYSVGVLLYEMLVGQLPFDADSPEAMFTMHAFAPPTPPRSINPNLPYALENILLRALEKNPDERYQSAADMGMALEQVAAEIGQAQARINIASPSRVDERDVDHRAVDALPNGHAIPHSKQETPTQQLDQSHSQKITVDLNVLEPAEPAAEPATNNAAPTAAREDVSLRFLLLLLLSGLVAVILGIALTFLLLGR
jgi:serine/threonine protein kinase